MGNHKPGNYNPHQKNGRFGKGRQYYQYASSDERDDAIASQDETKKAAQVRKSKVEALQKEIDEWKQIQKNPYESPYLKEKATKELRKLNKKLKSLE